MSEYTLHRKKQLSEMRPWGPDVDMDGVSISMPDRDAGSPKDGDWIARNPKNHEDRWLVAAEFYAANFEPAEEGA